MALKTVIVACVTKAQIFPLGTPEGLFTFQLRTPAGFVLSSVDTTSNSASFPSVPDGADYVAAVSKNGVTVTQAFNIPATDATFQVPDTLTITVG